MSTRRHWLIVVLLTPAVLGLCVALAQTGREDKKPNAPRAVTVPFEMLPSNHMVVEAKINGKGPYNLIFDLGAPVTLLSNEAAEATGVVDKNAPRSFLFSMRGEAEIGKLQLADLEAKDLPALVLNHPALKLLGQALGRPLDGIIGYTFFAHYKMTIDYQARKMTFEPVEFEVRNFMKDLPDRLAGPKVAHHRVLAPAGLWGLTIAPPHAGDISAPGVRVTTVRSGSPAAVAGLQTNDILTSIDGRWTTTEADTYAALAATPPDHPVPVVILRAGKELTMMVTPRAGI
ncbi:MAG TPA: PDZ domain-containing protein [Isosphaeraceae bacterium]|jgi:hypothetical protein|nr:PDZ domain-containing protein [Isosphaeraceae bacterium]